MNAVATISPVDMSLVNVAEESAAVDGLDVVNFSDVYNQGLPELAPELIKGVLRQGHKMLVSAPSKAGKSFALVELAVAIAEGRSWMGFKCRQGRVLYLNLEIDPPSFYNRLDKVYEEIAPNRETLSNIDVLNLRGASPVLAELVPKIAELNRIKKYDVCIFDPIYKLMTGGDENAAGDIGKFCNQLDKIASETGASVVFVHHYSKGAQGNKAAIDRASGSGVFGRDPDAVITLSDLKRTPDAETWLFNHYEEIDPLWKDTRAQNGMYKTVRKERIDRVTAWRIEFTLREFPPPAPVNVWFRYPVHVVDRAGILSGAAIVGGSMQEQQKADFDAETMNLEKAFDGYNNGEPVKAVDLERVLGIGRDTLKRRVDNSDKLKLTTFEGSRNLYVCQASYTPTYSSIDG